MINNSAPPSGFPKREMKSSPDRQIPIVDRTKVDPQLIKAAEGMEAMFIDHLFRTMRKTVPSSELSLESPASEVYRSMLDTELAQKSAQQGGIGLADQLIAYWQTQAYNGKVEELQQPRTQKNEAPKTQADNGGSSQ